MTQAEFEESIKGFGHDTRKWLRSLDRAIWEAAVKRPLGPVAKGHGFDDAEAESTVPVVTLEPATPPGPKDPCWRCYYGDLEFVHTCGRYGVRNAQSL